MNVITLVGRAVADPELRYTQSGTAVATVTVAVDRDFKNAQGERETDFIDCVAWRQTSELLAQYAEKGDLLSVTGRLQVRTYDSSEGTRRKAVEVVMERFRVLSSPNVRGDASVQPEREAAVTRPF